MVTEEAYGGKFLPAFFLEEVKLGDELDRGQLPLRMTLFPPVKAEFKQEYAQLLRKYIKPMDPFMATVGKPNTFGSSEKPVRVLEIEYNQRLIALQRKIVSVLQYLPHNTQFRAKFNAHVSIEKDDSRLETGDQIEIAGFSLVEMAPSTDHWKVIGKIGLKGSEMRTDGKIIKMINRD
ncbi:MAG: 2'-5' RNA ligase family protein [Candidatus Microsaccharimonas sp.]